MNKNPLYVAIAVLICLLAFMVGFMAFNKSTPPASPSPANAAANASTAAGPNAPTPGSPAARGNAPAAPEADPNIEPALADLLQAFDSPIWRPMNNGLDTDITKNEIHIHGISQFADWAHGNGIVANTPIPDGDFTLSVDIKIAKYDGVTEFKNPYLRVEARDRSAIGIFANPAFFYRMHDWKNPQTMSGTHKMFGDEATTFHRMTLRWQEATGNAIATVDKELIGTIKTNLGTGRRISLFANTQTKGIDIDVFFRNLKVDIPTPPAGGI